MRVFILPRLIVRFLFMKVIQGLSSRGSLNKNEHPPTTRNDGNHTALLKTVNREQSPFQF